MTIVVEDGTVGALGSPTPNSYVTVDEFTTFSERRGLTEIAESDDEEKEAALIKAIDYMQQKYRLMWKGSRIEAFQPLDWPRRGVDVPDFFDPFYKQTNVPISFHDTYFVPEDVVPNEVKEAQMLIAHQTYSGSESSGVLQPALGRTTKREKLGDLEVEYMDALDGHTRIEQKYWDAQKTIEPYLNPSLPYNGQILRN
jgi:hypothetical protein